MFSITKKEIAQFFGTPTGFLIPAFFQILTGIFLWLLPGESNILMSGYASLEPFFAIAPWLLMFLAPAITMRMFSEEFRGGTLYLILPTPVSSFAVVFSKFLPSLVFVLTTGLMAEPLWNVDYASALASFFALLLLSASFASIGIFASGLSSSQVTAFVTGVAFIFLLYSAFSLFGDLPFLRSFRGWIDPLSMEFHFNEMGKGILSFRNLWFFFAETAFWILLTRLVIGKVKRNWLIILAATIALGISDMLAFSVMWYHDFTDDKRYTLSDYTKEVLSGTGSPITVTLLLNGDVNAGFRNLEDRTQELLRLFERHGKHGFSFRKADPEKLLKSEKNDTLSEMIRKLELAPIVVFDEGSKGEKIKRAVYPYAIIHYKKRYFPVNLLVNIRRKSGLENLNASVENLEYQLMDGIRIITAEESKRVAFLEGHGEISEKESEDLTMALSRYYRVDRGRIGNNVDVLDSIDVLIVADPEKPFGEVEKFILDQFILNGKSVLWLIDGVNISTDSLRKGSTTLGIYNDLNLDDMFFRYGFRIAPVLVRDMQCAGIPVNVAPEGQPADIKNLPSTYLPKLFPENSNGISRNLSPVKTEFTSALEILGNNDRIKKYILLKTSPLTKIEKVPVYVYLNNMLELPDPNEYKGGVLPVGGVFQGTFSSLFTNRMTPPGTSGKIRKQDTGSLARMAVFADGDLARNEVEVSGNSIFALPLGVDRMSGQTIYSNKQLLLNVVHYLAGEDKLLELRSREVRLRLLNSKEANNSRVKWQLINLTSPLLLSVFLCLGFNLLRMRKFKRFH